MNNSATFQINILGNVFSAVTKLQKDFGGLNTEVKTLGDNINNTFEKFRSVVFNANIVSIITQAKEVSDAFASISGPGIGFEQSMANLSSITGTVGEDLVKLGKIARQTGVESGLGASQAAKAFEILASQIEVDDIGMDGLIELQRNSITLSHAAGITMDEAANALAGTINQYGLEAGEAARVINVLAAGSKYGAAEINDLAQSFKVVGAQASIAGLSVEDTAGALEILSKNNVKGAEAGTNLRNIILAMQTTLGVDFSKNTLAEALDALKPKLNDAAFMSETFGRMSMASAQFLVQNADAVADMTEKVTGTNTAMEQAATRTDTVQQMMARCRARVDDLKIGFFDLTGSFGGYATIVSEQLVTVSQLIPLFNVFGRIIGFVTNAEKLKAFWTGAVTAATKIWTSVQWLLNASLWACPVTWIVAGIIALIAVITVCVTKIQGWGAQWDSVVKFMKLSFRLFVEAIKYEFTTVYNGLVMGLDYIKLAWYKFKEAVGIGDSSQNREMISQISADIERRQTEIVEGARKLKDLAVEAGNALTWELEWKKSEKGDKDAKDALGLGKPVGVQVIPELAGGTGGGLDLDLSGKGGRGSGGKGSGSSGVLDLNKIVPNLKGSPSYSGAIAQRLAPVMMAASVALPLAMSAPAPAVTPAPIPPIAAAPVTPSMVAPEPMPSDMPLTMAATILPQDTKPAQRDLAQADYRTERSGRGSVTMQKFCDNIVINIAKPDGAGMDEIERRIRKTIDEVLEDYA